VEESLASVNEWSKPVFVSRITDEGNADSAGILVGDIIIKVSGVFGEMEDVAGIGLTRVQNLVSSRPPTEPLMIHVARGTSVESRHNKMLVDMCTNQYGSDEDIEGCLTSIMMGDSSFGDSNPNLACLDDETECMVNSMYNMWNEDVYQGAEDTNKIEEKKPKKKIAPWSSRSSPSGTYVRDPKTGKMTNLDDN